MHNQSFIKYGPHMLSWVLGEPFPESAMPNKKTSVIERIKKLFFRNWSAFDRFFPNYTTFGLSLAFSIYITLPIGWVIKKNILKYKKQPSVRQFAQYSVDLIIRLFKHICHCSGKPPQFVRLDFPLRKILGICRIGSVMLLYLRRY